MVNYKLKRIDWSLMVLLFLFSLILRLPNLDTDLETDGADYAQAAKMGFLVNYLDLGSRPTLDFIKQGIKDKYSRGDTDLWVEDYANGDVAAFRHYHSPLIIYFIGFSMSLFGTQEMVLRFTPLLFGALTCSLLYFVCLRSFDENGRYMGVIASVLLAITPLHAEVSKYVSWHSTYMFWEITTLFFLSQAFKHNSTRYLYISFIFLALAFLTLEYAPLLLLATFISLLVIKNKWLLVSGKEIVLSNHLFLGFILVLVLFIVIWPASVLKLSMLKNYIVYSSPISSGQIHFRHGSWYTVYYVFFLKNIFLSTLIIVSISYTGYLFLKRKLTINSLPLFIYPMLLFVINLRVGFVKPAYISHMLPFFIIACAITLSKLFESKIKKVKIIPVVVILFLMFCTNLNGLLNAQTGKRYMKDVSAYFDTQLRKGALILVGPEEITPLYKYYLQGHNIEFYYSEKDELDIVLKRINENEFEYFIFEGSETDVKQLDIYPYLKERFKLVKVVKDRSGKDVSRIYKYF
jgi:4-amino-4-deoxy-L-arabinose transferase-like glycosyltransferase